MKLEIEINNVTESPVKDEFFESVIEKTFQVVGSGFLEEKDISISIALVSESEMQKLNRENRQKDSVTDILSFYEYENLDEIRKTKEKEIFLGELILCYDDIRKYASEEKIELKRELVNVISHGVLHLLGFDHGEKMFSIQKKVINEVC